MTAEDMPFGMMLKSQAGWNQVVTDWQRFLHMQPEGCLVAELNGVAVGTTVVTTFDTVAWISMVLVEQSFWGRGVGKTLMNRAVQVAEELGCATIRLDATPLGQPLYESLGFVPQYELTRYAGMIAPNDTFSSPPSRVRFAGAAYIPSLVALDTTVTGTQRGRFLFYLFTGLTELRIVETDGSVIGYLTIRPGIEALQLGPCIAETAEAAGALLTDALSRRVGSRVYWDVPSSHLAAAQLAQSAGLAPQRKVLRMCRGKAVNDDVAKLWASSGPELG
jgi:predicted N-acetyltransferase YhbS